MLYAYSIGNTDLKYTYENGLLFICFHCWFLIQSYKIKKSINQSK